MRCLRPLRAIEIIEHIPPPFALAAVYFLAILPDVTHCDPFTKFPIIQHTLLNLGGKMRLVIAIVGVTVIVLIHMGLTPTDQARRECLKQPDKMWSKGICYDR